MAYRITGVQAGIIQASSGVFLSLFLLTLVMGVTAIYSAEKMYVTAHLQNVGVMRALGGSKQKLFAQLFVEIVLAAVLSGLLTYGLSKGITPSSPSTCLTSSSRRRRTFSCASWLFPSSSRLGCSAF